MGIAVSITVVSQERGKHQWEPN